MEYQYNIEGLNILIDKTVELSPDVEDLILKAIITACHYKKLVQHFPQLKFVILYETPERKNSLAHVNDDDLANGRYIINIKSKTVMENLSEIKLEKDKINEIVAVIIHELTHCWQVLLSSAAKQRWVIKERLEKQVRQFPTDLGTLRLLMNNFIQSLQNEGLATFNEYTIRNLIRFFDTVFEQYYKNALEEAYNLKLSWLNFMAKKLDPKSGTQIYAMKALNEAISDIGKKLYSSAYKIGLHMVYTIYYVDSTPLETLAKMDYLTFVKEYEECIRKKGYKPIVTLTNEQGIIVYKKLLEELQELK